MHLLIELSQMCTRIVLTDLQFDVVIAFPSHQIIAMPALSPTMTAGNIGTWQKKAGDSVAPGDVLVEIETDKAQMDFEFQEEGVLAKILLDSGEKDVAVGSVSHFQRKTCAFYNPDVDNSNPMIAYRCNGGGQRRC